MARSGLGISDAIRISPPIDDVAVVESLDLKRKRVRMETAELTVVKAKAMLPVYVEREEIANEAAKIANEAAKIANETQQIANETARLELEQKKKAGGSAATQVAPKAVVKPAGSKPPKEVSIWDIMQELKQPWNKEDSKVIGGLVAKAYKDK